VIKRRSFVLRDSHETMALQCEKKFIMIEQKKGVQE
jgi:hypothetical protein